MNTIMRWVPLWALGGLAGSIFGSNSMAGAESPSDADVIWLSRIDVSQTETGWGVPHADRSIDNHPLTVAGVVFQHGIGTHADSNIPLQLDGRGIKLSGAAGVDDEVGGSGSVTFQILADGKEIWSSGLMHGGEQARAFSLDLVGAKTLVLNVSDAGDGINYDHADWVDLGITTTDGVLPGLIKPPAEEETVLTPKAPATPRINGAKVFGVRPGSPFFFKVAATGDRPMRFAAVGLPVGLNMDAETGLITGVLSKPGEYTLRLHAKNALGRAEQDFKIVCGSRIGLTPAMGWNSWNCFANAVTEEKIKAAADAMVQSGLVEHGWTYINIDDFWQVHRDSKDPTLQGPQRDADGRILPNPRFPDMKGLVDYVHSRGLKIGIYSSPGPWTCGGCVGSFDHELQDARQYAEWGFDYLKYDWCSYNPDLESQRKNSRWMPGSINQPDPARSQAVNEYMRPYKVMEAALARQPRDILYSLCQYGMGNVWEWGDEVRGNSWRTTGDITDTWSSMSGIGFAQAGHKTGAGPGHFNDPDMLVVGMVGWGPRLHPTRLSPNEQYTHISLWCLLSSPLLIGCDMTQLDDFTLGLLTNDEVLAVDQDALGRQASRVVRDGTMEIWAKDLADGSKAVGLFNRGPAEQSLTMHWSDLGLGGRQVVRDLWRQKDLGTFDGQFQATVARHGVVLIRVIPADVRLR